MRTALLLSVWREACRHTAIEESTNSIARVLIRELPVARVLVRRLDLARLAVQTVAAGPPGADAGEPRRRECSAEEFRRLLAWCRRGEVLHGAADAPPPDVRAVLPRAARGDVMAGPLGGAEGPAGVLVLVSPPARRFTARHRAVLEALLEPFSVALDNDSRVREMTALREAAEADRRSLLARLGRQDLADLIVGSETGLRQVMERVALVSRSDVPVLILGETGSGKELVARAIRHRSDRAAGPFMRVNCGSIPSELIDSELFGHERGSFTGAVATRKGWFERADGGTLFLDEIGELPLAAQVRLLHVLQDGHFERVGGQQPVRVDVRIIAATHQDLTAMVRRGTFREDLWYRIAVFPILVPPLRERPEDVPALAAHFAQRAAVRFGLPLCQPTRDDLTLLLGYAWPGNVRELGTVIDRAAILGDGRRLEVAAALGGGGPAAPREPPPAVPALPAPGVVPLDDAVRRHIESALAATRGRIEGPHGAAMLLGVNPHTLRGRMRRLGIDWRRFRAHSKTNTDRTETWPRPSLPTPSPT